jgi:hypothetical protein
MSEVIILRQFDKMGYAESQFCLRGLLVGIQPSTVVEFATVARQL